MIRKYITVIFLVWKSFEPGSTFKIVTYSAGLEENKFNLNELLIVQVEGQLVEVQCIVGNGRRMVAYRCLR